MHEIALIRATLRLNGTQLSLDRLSKTRGPEPASQANPEQNIPASLFAYWVDLRNEKKEVIYRRFINNTIPLNLNHSCKVLGKRYQKYMRFKIEVPALQKATMLEIYEQALMQETDSEPSLKLHLRVSLQAQPVTAVDALCI